MKISNRFLLILLIACLCLNAIVHLMSPANRNLQLLRDDLDDRYTAFEYKVQRDFVPSLSNIVEKIKYRSPDTEDCSAQFKSSFFSLPFLKCATFSYVDAYALGSAFKGCLIDGRFYEFGALVYGSPIVEIFTNCAVTDDFLIGSVDPRKDIKE